MQRIKVENHTFSATCGSRGGFYIGFFTLASWKKRILSVIISPHYLGVAFFAA